MSLLVRNISILIVLFFIGTIGYSQTKKVESDTISTESVVVIKTFNPTINDAFKIHPKPNFDEVEGAEKEPLTIKINSVPVASTFVPEKTKSIAVKKESPEDSFKNYARIGAGNLGNVIAEVFSAVALNKESQFTAFLEHQSSQGGIKDVQLDDYFYDTGLQLAFGKYQKDKQWSVDLEAQHQLYNWYGLSDELSITEADFNAIDPAHNFIDVNLGGNLQMDQDIFTGGSVRFRHFRDDYESTENNLKLNPQFTVPLSDYAVQVPVVFDYLGGTFAENESTPESKYSILNFGLKPTIALNFNDIDVKIGISAFLSSNFEESKLRLFAYPNLTATYNFYDYSLSLFGGVTGGLKQNSYHNAVETNPFVAPNLLITPTNEKFNVFAGVQGQFLDKFSYKLKGSVEKVDDLAVFVKNPVLNTPTSALNYGYNNSFTYVYEDYNIGRVNTEFGYEEENSYTIQLKADYFLFSDRTIMPFNLPNFKASLLGDYFLNEKTTIGMTLFYFGERKAFDALNAVEKELEAFVDVNLRAEYKINKQFSAFAMGNNLTAQNYERWLDYPVQGIQLLVGVKYKF